jgi:hypothetical protein
MDIMNGFRFDSPRFKDYMEACEWVHDNIEYRKTKGIIDPQTTLDRGYGDCGDMALLLMAIMGYQKGMYYTYYVSLKTETEGINHAVIEADGWFYDPTAGKRSHNPGKIDHKKDYYKAMQCGYSDYQ